MAQNAASLELGQSAPIRIGDVVDKYRVERVLGMGAMGLVVAARHVTLDQVVAIKFLMDIDHLSFVEFDFGQGAALGNILIVISLVFAALYLRGVRRGVEV